MNILALPRFLSIAGAVLFVTTGCDSSTNFSTSQTLSLQIQGVHRAPSGSEGNGTPRNMVMTFVSLILTNNDGEEVDLSPEETVEVTVINRPQIFFEADLAEYDGITFDKITVSFEAAVELTGKFDSESLELTSAQINDTEGFTVKPAASHLLAIEAEWLNTVTLDEDAETETFSLPTFSAELGND